MRTFAAAWSKEQDADQTAVEVSELDGRLARVTAVLKGDYGIFRTLAAGAGSRLRARESCRS